MRLYLGVVALATAWAACSTGSEATKAPGEECKSDGECRNGCSSPYWVSGARLEENAPQHDAGADPCGHAGEPACVCAGPSCHGNSDCAAGWVCKSGGVFNPDWCVPTCGHCPVGLVCEGDGGLCKPE